MAKKNKNKQNAQQPLSPERFLREKARGLEIGTCFVSNDIWEAGLGNVVVTRLHKGGKRTLAYFLVDVFCLGVKGAGYRVRMDEVDYDMFMEHYDEGYMREASYKEAHNIIYGAVAFAEEAGISPCKEFALAQYVLEEDTDDIPLMEYQYGKDGMHFLFAHSQLEASRYLPLLSKNLGEGNYRFVVPTGYDTYVPQKFDRKANARNCKKWEQPYTRIPPHTSPVELNVTNQRVLDILTQDEHYILSDEEVDELLALPHDELRHDVHNILEHALGAWWENPDEYEYPYFPTVGHALMLLGEVGEEEDLDLVLETLRMPYDYLSDVFGDFEALIIMPAIFQLGQNQLDKLMDFIKETGLENFYKDNVVKAVLHVGLDLERRDDAVEWHSRLLHDIVEDFPNATYTDTLLNAFIVNSLVKLAAVDALPDIRRLYDLHFVDLDVNGIFEDVVADMGKYDVTPIELDIKRRFKTMKKMYER